MMLSNLVLAYPKISREDYNWMQSVRKEFDGRYYNVVEPHFTIVFPVFNFDTDLLINHIKSSCDNFKPILFTIGISIIVKDSFSEFTDVFLVPDKGNSQIIKMHDKLYTGILSNELRLDIPFIPHIGIGASKNPNEAKNISDKLNSGNIFIKGVIDELEIVEYEYPVVKSISKIMLK